METHLRMMERPAVISATTKAPRAEQGAATGGATTTAAVSGSSSSSPPLFRRYEPYYIHKASIRLYALWIGLCLDEVSISSLD